MKNNDFNKELLYNLISVALIIFVGLTAYSNSFGLGWHFDDEPNIINNTAIRDITNLSAIWHFDTSRFVTVFSIALNYHLGNVLVFGYHIVNLSIHLISAILIWWFIRLLFSTPLLKNKDYKSGVYLIPLFSALIFVSHPVQTQAVTYIIQRAASLAALFYIASVSFYIKFRLAKSTDSKRFLFYSLAFISCILGMFSKEISFTLPIMLLVVEFCFFYPENKFSFKLLIPFFLTMLIIPFVVLFLHPTAMKETAEASGRISSFTYLMTEFRVIVTYLRLFILPVNLNLDYDFPLSKSFFEFKTLLSFLFLLACVVFAAFMYKKHRIITFGIAWFFLTLAVESSIWPIKDVIYEHRLYLPLTGLIILFLFPLFGLLQAKYLKIFIIANSIIILVFTVATYQRNFVWENEQTLWTDVIKKSPEKYRPHINRGLALLRRFDVDNAMKDFLNGLKYDPNNAIAYCNMGAIWGLKEEREKALECFNKAILLDPKYEEAYNNRGSILFQLKDYSKAFADFDTAIKLKPNSTNGYNNRGTLHFMLGEYDKALNDYFLALKIDYTSKDILKNIGLAYDQKKEYQNALTYYNKALAIDPGYPNALFNRAVIYYILNQPELAKKDIAKMKAMGFNADADFAEKIRSLQLSTN